MNKHKIEAAIRDYSRDGIAVVRDVVPTGDLDCVIDEISLWIDARATSLAEQGEISELYKSASFEERYGLLFRQSKKMSHGLDIMFMRGRTMFEFLFNAQLLNLLEPILGPEISCNPIQHLRAKPPAEFEGHDGPSFHNAAWHQDAGVMMQEADQSNIVTCWLPLGDSTLEMGCLHAMPGMAELGYLAHERNGETTIVDSAMPSRDGLPLVCRKGDVVLMSRFTPHCSTPNRSTLCRWSLDLRYQTTGHHTGRTAHPDFVVRSAHAEKEQRDYDLWCERWKAALSNPTGFSGHRVDQ